MNEGQHNLVASSTSGRCDYSGLEKIERLCNAYLATLPYLASLMKSLLSLWLCREWHIKSYIMID